MRIHLSALWASVALASVVPPGLPAGATVLTALRAWAPKNLVPLPSSGLEKLLDSLNHAIDFAVAQEGVHR